MRPCLLIAALAACAFGQSKDLDRIQGSWKFISLAIGGQAVPAAPPDARLVIEGSRFTSLGMGDTYMGIVELDPSKAPKVITLHFTDGPEKGNSKFGIYEFDGERWRLCLNTGAGGPPSKFESTSAAIVLEVLERDVTELEGEWSMVSGTFDGEPLPAEYVRMGKRVVSGNRMTVTFGAEVYSKGTFTLNRSAKPAAIDAQNTEGANAGKTQLGIYERSGKTLKLSLAAAGRDRPADFTTTPGDGRTVVIWTLKD